MKKIISILMCVILVLSFASCTTVDNEEITFDKTAMEQMAKDHANDLVSGNIGSVYGDFDDNLKSQINEDGLREAWEKVVDGMGEHIKNYSVTSQADEEHYIVIVVEEYEESGIRIDTAYDKYGKIAGIYFNYEAIEKGPIKTEDFTENKVEVGSENPLDGLLTIPNNVENPPVVLLVQGSGALDKNSTVYANKPMEDIAHGLAQNGIASLRYDKRFLIYPEEAQTLGGNVTLEDEILNDVELAIELLANDERVDSSNIYVLGHSLGGSLTPYIATSNEKVKGVISLAGTLNPIYELSYDQNKAIEEMVKNGDYDQTTKDSVEEQMIQVEKDIEVLRGDLDDVANETILMGTFAGYQKSVKEYAGLNFVNEIPDDYPILVLQGSADFQVSHEKDYQMWQDELDGNTGAEFKLYEDLNHLFMTTNGKSDITEYETKGEVHQDVINDISQFVKN